MDRCSPSMTSRYVRILIHDGVSKWKHFPRYWPFARGIHRRIPLTKGQWRGALMFSLICAWINGWVKKIVRLVIWTPSRSLWHHCNAFTSSGTDHAAMSGHYYDCPEVGTVTPVKWGEIDQWHSVVYGYVYSHMIAQLPGMGVWSFIPAFRVATLGHDDLARRLVNGNAAFIEWCAAIGWQDCDSVMSL